MKITDIAYVVYAVSELKKSRAFYEGVLGLKVTKSFLGPDENFGMIEYDIGSSTLAIGCGAPVFKPSSGGGVAALEVADFEKAVARLRESGVKFVVEPQEHPPCHMAVFSDPDGNTLMLHRRKAK